MDKSLDILKRLKVFMAQFKKSFISLYVQKWEETYPDFVFSKNQKRILTKLYDYIFPMEDEKVHFSQEEWSGFTDNKDVSDLLSDIFIDMSLAFVSFLKKKNYDITYLLVFTNRLGEFLLELQKGRVGGNVLKNENSEKIENTPEVYKQFEILKKQDKSVSMLNLYKGIPLNFNASIIRVSDHFASLRVHKYQAMVMDIERQTYIKLNRDVDVVKARVLSVDTSRQIANVTKFYKVKDSAFNRENVRVQPKEAIKINIRYKKNKVKGWMEELSLNGISVDVTELENLSKNIEVDIDFKLPSENQEHYNDVYCKGKIINISSINNGFRLGIYTYPDKIAEKPISNFVYKRQIELIKELHYYSL